MPPQTIPAIVAEWDPREDAQRRKRARWSRVVYEWQWARDDTQGQGDRLLDPAGLLMERQLEARYQAGPPSRPKQDPAAPRGSAPTEWEGRGARWRLLGAAAQLFSTPLHDILDELTLIESPTVSGDVVSGGWEWWWSRVQYGRMFSARQRGVIGLQSMAVRPTLARAFDRYYYPAGVVEVPPDQCFAIADPAEPGRAAVFGCRVESGGETGLYQADGSPYQRGGWLVWDLSEPWNPIFGLWGSPEDWHRWRMSMGYHHAPEWEMSGGVYPWTWRGQAFQPCVCQQWDSRTRELLPCSMSTAQGVLDLMLQRIWIMYCFHVVSTPRTFALSTHPLAGFGQMMNEPGALTNIWGPDAASLVTVPHGMDGVVAMEGVHERLVEKFARRFNPGFEIQKKEAESGTALRLRSAGKHRLRRRQAEQARRVDVEIIKGGISTHNYLQRSGQQGPWWGASGYIPEGDMALRYPYTLDAIEAAEEEANTLKAVERGVEFEERLHLLRMGDEQAERGSPEWEAATQYIEEAGAVAARRVQFGIGLRPQDRYIITTKTPEDEAALHTPSAATADSAAKGLELRAQFRRGWGADGSAVTMTPAAKANLSRAKRIRNQDPMTLGDVRALNTWLRQHSDDGTQPSDVGQWGNESDPSALWIEYLSQGGDPGLDWSGLILAGSAAPTAAEGGTLEGEGDGNGQLDTQADDGGSAPPGGQPGEAEGGR